MEKRIRFERWERPSLKTQAWLRTFALILDIYLIEILVRLLFSPFFEGVGIPIISVLMYFIYSTFLEASMFQATLGKWFIGFKVCDYGQNRISIRSSILRNIFKIISTFSIFGFFMLDASKRKQALHDIISKTLVVRRHRRL